jgi:hypothetical protein
MLQKATHGFRPTGLLGWSIITSNRCALNYEIISGKGTTPKGPPHNSGKIARFQAFSRVGAGGVYRYKT